MAAGYKPNAPIYGSLAGTDLSRRDTRAAYLRLGNDDFRCAGDCRGHR